MVKRIGELPPVPDISGEQQVATWDPATGKTVTLTVDQIIALARAVILDGSPEALDTLNELAAALGDDANFATNVAASIATKLALAGGTMTGALTLAGAPAADLQAATKKYVDDLVALRLLLSGGTMTGLLTLSGAPSSNLHAATKAYADTKLPLGGGTLTGALTLSGAPSSALHAATKAYVDAITTLRESWVLAQLATDPTTIAVGSSFVVIPLAQVAGQSWITSGNFVAPAAGRYRFTCTFGGFSGEKMRLSLLNNANAELALVAYAGAADDLNNNPVITGARTLNCTAGQVVKIGMYHGAAASKDQQGVYFEVFVERLS